MILQYRAAGRTRTRTRTHTHSLTPTCSLVSSPIQRPKEALAENTNWIQLLEIPGKINVHSHTRGHACTHSCECTQETQNLLSVLKRKAAVYKMLRQTCARVQEQKIKSADVNKEKIPEFDFFENPANRVGLAFD